MKSTCVVCLPLFFVALQALASGEASVGPKKTTLLQDSHGANGTKLVNISQTRNLGETGSTAPYFAKVITNTFICGGTLITKRHVLTTATCIKTAGRDTYMVHFPQLQDAEGNYPQHFGSFCDWNEHPKYGLYGPSYAERYNMALIWLSDDVLANYDEMRPVHKLHFGYLQPLQIVEYIGTTLQPSSGSAACVGPYVFKFLLTTQKTDSCLKAYHSTSMTTFMCAITAEAYRACSYDEGGPVIFNDFGDLIGIVGVNECSTASNSMVKIIKITDEIGCWLQEQTKRDFGATCTIFNFECKPAETSNMLKGLPERYNKRKSPVPLIEKMHSHQ